MSARYAGDTPPEVDIRSDLLGIDIDLPAPLGKARTDRRPLAVRIRSAADTRQVTVAGGSAGSAVAEYVRDQGDWRLARGRIHLGPGDAGTLPRHGLAVSGRLAAWTHSGALSLPLDGFTAPVSELDLRVDALEAFGRPLGEVYVQGRRTEPGWHLLVDGERIAGHIDLPAQPDNDNPIRAEFERVALTPGGERPRHGELDARLLPPIAFHAAAFSVGTVRLGEVNGFLRKVENGVVLERFTATRRELHIAGDLDWRTVDGFHRTTARGTVDSTDVRRALGALGYAATMDAAAGHVQFDLDWLDTPLADPLPLLNGEVLVRFERGTLYDVQPGAGRVFGLLSLYALPRRLALDFSDVYRRGLAFDSLGGTFRIEAGDAYTDDLHLEGPAARVHVRGRTGLATREYDQEAVVVGSLAASLTVAGTLAGGPGVGAAMLIASELFRAQLEDMSSARYRVTGPWDKPLIERMLTPSR